MEKVVKIFKYKRIGMTSLFFGLICIVVTFFRSTFIMFAVPLLIVAGALLWKSDELEKTLTDEEKEFSELYKNRKQISYIMKKTDKFAEELKQIKRYDISVDKNAEPIANKVKRSFRIKSINKDTGRFDIFPLVAVDIETTGLDPEKDKIIEISAIRFGLSFKPSDAFTTLINPKKHIPKSATNINGITDDMVSESPEIHQVMQSFNEFVKDCNIVGQNVEFDLSFLCRDGMEISPYVSCFDTLETARRTIPKSEIGNYKLESLCNYYSVFPSEMHRSLSDALAVSKVFKRLVDEIKLSD